jgi:hypothetical protein
LRREKSDDGGKSPPIRAGEHQEQTNYYDIRENREKGRGAGSLEEAYPCPGDLRHKPDAGIHSAPESILGNSYTILIHDDRAELFFQDQLRESLYLVPEGSDPFAPEQHALDIAHHIWLYVVSQELVKDLKFPDLILADVAHGHSELFTKTVQHLKAFFPHKNRDWANVCVHCSINGLVDLFWLRDPVCAQDPGALRG